MSSYTSHNMKKIISNIQSSRSSIVSKKNIPTHLSSLKQTFNELESTLKGQSVYVRELDISTLASQHQQKPSQQKKNLIRMIDLVYQQIAQYIEVCKEGLNINLKDKKQIGGWDKLQIDIWKKLEALKTSPSTNIFQTIFKIMNLRDHLIKQILKGIIYQKHLLWLDLKIPYESYVHHQIQSALDTIKSSHQKYGYVPTKLQFSSISPSMSEGRWSLVNTNSKQTSVPSFLKITLKDFKQVIDTIKNYSSLNETSETFEDVNKNQVIVKGLREKIEQYSINYNLLLEKYRSIQTKDYQGELKSKVDELTKKNLHKQQQINLLHTTISSHQNIIHGLKDKQKQLQDQVLKLNINYYPKLKEVDGFQKVLIEQFSKIRKQVEAISVSLENDNQLKNRLQGEIKDQKELVNNLVNMLGRERRKTQEIRNENKKLDELVNQLTNKHFSS